MENVPASNSTTTDSDSDVTVNVTYASDNESMSNINDVVIVEEQQKSKKTINVNIPECDTVNDQILTIKNELCKKLSMSVFTDITADLLAERSQVRKLHLASYLLSVISVYDKCEAVTNSVSTATTKHCEYVTSDEIELIINTALLNNTEKQYNLTTSIEQQIEQLNQHLSEISQLTNIKRAVDIPVNDDSHSHKNTPHQIPHNPLIHKGPTCEPYTELIKDFISQEDKADMLQLAKEKEEEFSNIGDKRHVLYFGEYKYKYSGGHHEPSPTPEILKKVADKIQQKHPEHKLSNSCLMSKYTDGEEYCPPHRDDEDSIDPESYIYTISIGAERPINYKNNLGTRDEDLMLPDCSLLVCSRKSQDGWMHSIPQDPSIKDVRYSFTFRLVAPFFINSTLICGDSNTHNLTFGEGFGKFGKWLPGKRVKASRIQHIPDGEEICPFKNIVIHTGINDLNRDHIKPPNVLAHELEMKCRAIHKCHPKSKIFISPLLPTKDSSLNSKVKELNYHIMNVTDKYQNIVFLDNSSFVNNQGTLRTELGRHRMGLPDHADSVHLGRKGIMLFAKGIKSSLIKRVTPRRLTPNGNHATAFNSNPSQHHDGTY